LSVVIISYLFLYCCH